MRRADRIVVAVIAAFDVVAAALLAAGFGDHGAWLAPLWAPVFAAAGVSCAAFAARPRSHPLMVWSGMLTSAGLFGRAAVLIVGILRGDLALDDRRAWLGVATWAAFGLVCGFLWNEVLRPATGDRRRKPRQ